MIDILIRKFLPWALGTAIGWKFKGFLIGGIGILAIIGAIVLYRKGWKASELRYKAKELEVIKKKVQVDEKIRNMSPDERRDRLRKWVQ